MNDHSLDEYLDRPLRDRLDIVLDSLPARQRDWDALVRLAKMMEVVLFVLDLSKLDQPSLLKAGGDFNHVMGQEPPESTDAGLGLLPDLTHWIAKATTGDLSRQSNRMYFRYEAQHPGGTSHQCAGCLQTSRKHGLKVDHALLVVCPSPNSPSIH